MELVFGIMGSARSHRDEAILRMRREGRTLEEIGSAVGLTRERVRQILKKIGGPTKTDLARARQDKQEQTDRRLRRAVCDYFTSHATATWSELAAALRTDEATVRRLTPRDLRARILQPHSAGVDLVTWSDEAILEALQHAATYEFPLTAKRYGELIQIGEVRGPTPALVSKRLGGWIQACELAGVEAGSAPRDNYDSRWSDEDILRSVAAYLRDPSFSGSAHRYDEWRRLSAPDAPSLPTVRNRIGTWTTAKRRAMELSTEDEAFAGLGPEARRLDAILARHMASETRESIWRSARAILDVGPLSTVGRAGTTSLALGYVQSGKTTSITALIAMAADAGYRVVVALLGTTNLLLDQNRTRLEDALGIGERTDYVWVREVNPSGVKGERSIEQHLKRGRVILVPVLKNSRRIGTAAKALSAAADFPVMIIDDEADQASLNTSRESQSSTHAAIRELREALPNHLFVQYTATPYAPLLLDDDDLLHPDHVEFLQPGKGYTGGKQFFVDHAESVVRDVPALEEQATKQAPLVLPKSLERALANFLAGAAVLLADNLANAPVSMLVHSTARNDVQERYEFLIRRKLRSWSQELAADVVPGVILEEAQRLHSLGTGELQREKMMEWLRRVMTEAEVSLVNSTTAMNRVDWTVSPVHILIGGNKLDRGFTVEGLTVTYMNRPASPQVDTLEQRARAFGYRGDLLPFCQFFASRRTIRALRDIVFTELDLRARLQEHIESGGDLASWAREFGLLMPDGMKPSRDAVLNALARTSSGWHALRNPSLRPEDTERNWQLVRDTGLFEAPVQDYGRLEHPTLTMSVGDVVQLLEAWAGPDMGPGWSLADVLAALKRKGEFYDSLQVVLLQEQEGPRLRKWDETIGFINLFQGRDAAYTPDRTDAYPGDRAVPDLDLDPNVPAVQVHRVSPRGTQLDLLVPAVYLGEQHITRKVEE